MTLLKAANVFFFQWFFMRLTKCMENIVESYDVQSYELTPGGISSRGKGQIKTYSWLSLQMWIVPCTGWWSNFICLGKKRKFIQLTKKKRDNPRLA